MTKLRGEYEELLNLLRDSNEVVNNSIILHKNGKLKEAELWQVLAQESDKTKMVRKRLAVVRKEIILEEISIKKEW